MKIGHGDDLWENYIPDEGVPALCVLTLMYRDMQWLSSNIEKKEPRTELSTALSSPTIPRNKAINFEMIKLKLQNKENEIGKMSNVNAQIAKQIANGFTQHSDKQVKVEIQTEIVNKHIAEKVHKQITKRPKSTRKRVPLSLQTATSIKKIGRVNIDRTSTSVEMRGKIVKIFESMFPSRELSVYLLEGSHKRDLLGATLDIDATDSFLVE
jgi:hypothetical protein